MARVYAARILHLTDWEEYRVIDPDFLGSVARGGTA